MPKIVFRQSQSEATVPLGATILEAAREAGRRTTRKAAMSQVRQAMWYPDYTVFA